MYDLIDESGKDLKSFGYKIKELEKFSTSHAFLNIDSLDKSKRLGMSMGQYYIINSPYLYDYGVECYYYISSLLTKQFEKVLKKEGLKKGKKVLVVGLGNPDIPSDRLGKEVFDNIEIDALSKNNNIFKFCPNIFFSTGIDTASMIKIFIKELSIDYCIIIDSLTTSNISRLGTSFQLTTSGMTPGSGVNRFGKKIDKQSMGVPCFSVGVPFMIYSNSFDGVERSDLILSPKDVKQNVESAGFIIAHALNEVLKWITIYLYHFLF